MSGALIVCGPAMLDEHIYATPHASPEAAKFSVREVGAQNYPGAAANVASICAQHHGATVLLTALYEVADYQALQCAFDDLRANVCVMHPSTLDRIPMARRRRYIQRHHDGEYKDTILRSASMTVVDTQQSACALGRLLASSCQGLPSAGILLTDYGWPILAYAGGLERYEGWLLYCPRDLEWVSSYAEHLPPNTVVLCNVLEFCRATSPGDVEPHVMAQDIDAVTEAMSEWVRQQRRPLIVTRDVHGSLYCLPRDDDDCYVMTASTPYLSTTLTVGGGDAFAACLLSALAKYPTGSLAGALGTMIYRAHWLAAECLRANRKLGAFDEMPTYRSGDAWAIAEPYMLTNGCFDLLHKGHESTLTTAAATAYGSGVALVVGVNDDESVRRLKGDGRPVRTQQERMLDVAFALRHAVLMQRRQIHIMGFDGSVHRLIEAIGRPPAAIIKGGDYAPADVVGAELCGLPPMLMPYLKGISTTNILAEAENAGSAG